MNLLPATTGEGPDRCWLCGELRSEINQAPIGEPACRVCGCRPRTGVDPKTLRHTKQQIRGLVGEIEQFAKSKAPPVELGPFVLVRMTQALAAHGAILWRAPAKNWWQSSSLPQMEYSCGQTDGPEFAAKVIQANELQVCEGVIAGTTFLLIGVPIVKGERVCGALEVVQRPGAPPMTQRGYMRFAQQMVELVTTGSELFS